MNAPVTIRPATKADAVSIARLTVDLGYAIHPEMAGSHIRAIIDSAADLLIVAVDSSSAVVVRSNVRRLESHSFYPTLGYSAAKTQVVYRKPLAGTADNPPAEDAPPVHGARA